MGPKFLRAAVSLVLLLAASVAAQTPPRARLTPADYFPLTVGNHWIYQQRGAGAGEPVSVEVIGAAEYDGKTYYTLAGFIIGAPIQVRQTETGDLVQYDPGSRSEKLWYAFRSGTWKPERLCAGEATIARRDAKAPLPGGSQAQGLTIQYTPGICADAGPTEETFAPGVGLVRRIETTFAGPREWDLIYASLNGVLLAGPDLSFTLAIDRPVYPADPVPVMQARLTIRNTSSLPLSLPFNSGQQYDLAIRDATGRQVFLWSEGRGFVQVLTRLDLNPGEKTFVIEVKLADHTGKTFPEGRYAVEGWLTTSGGKQYSATLPFEIR